MGLSNIETNYNYLSIKEGKIFFQDQGFNCFEGYLTNIKTRVKSFNGKDTELLDFYFNDDEGEDYIISSSKTSGTSRSLLNYLAFIEDEKLDKPIKINTYLNTNNNLTKMQVYYDNNKLDWRFKDLKEKGDLNILFDEIIKELRSKLISDNLPQKASIDNEVDLNSRLPF